MYQKQNQKNQQKSRGGGRKKEKNLKMKIF